MKNSLLKVVIGLVVAAGSQALMAPQAQANKPCTPSDCEFDSCPTCGAYYPGPGNGDGDQQNPRQGDAKSAKVAYGIAVPDANDTCKDCDGSPEGANGDNHGDCVSNWYGFNTQWYDCVLYAYYTDANPNPGWRKLEAKYQPAGPCYYKVYTHKGAECGRTAAR